MMSATSATQQLTITLPNEIVDMIRASVLSGEYADDAEAIEAALTQALVAPHSNGVLESWIATEGVRRYDAMKADPGRGLTPEKVSASLDLEREERS